MHRTTRVHLRIDVGHCQRVLRPERCDQLLAVILAVSYLLLIIHLLKVNWPVSSGNSCQGIRLLSMLSCRSRVPRTLLPGTIRNSVIP